MREFNPKLCYANTFVLVDVRIAEELNQNISYLKGLFLNKALVKETDLDTSAGQSTTGVTLRTCTVGFLNIFSLPDLLRSCSLHFFRHRSLLRQLLSKVKLLPVYRRSTTTNSSSSIHPLFSCIEKAHILGNIFKNFELLSYIVTCTSPLGSTKDTNI